jgi:hypothetical protein
MFKTALLAFYIFWFMDLINLNFMEQFDTTYPINTIFWLGAHVLTLIVYESPELLRVHKDE